MTRYRFKDTARSEARDAARDKDHTREVFWCVQWDETADIAHTVLRGGRYQQILVMNGREPIGRIQARHLADLARQGALLTRTRAGDIMESLSTGGRAAS